MTTRAEHLQWCKDRALQYLPANTSNALTSMMSDLGKHPETANHAGIELTMMLMLSGKLSTPTDVKRHIEGFN